MEHCIGCRHEFAMDIWGRHVFCVQIAKNMITHLLMLRFLRFQRDSFVSYRFASEVTREEVFGTTAGGEGCVVSLRVMSKHTIIEKHEISPHTGLIWTVPTRQPRLRSILGCRNAFGCPCDHYRTRTGGRRLRRWTGDFFRCRWPRWLWGRQQWMNDGPDTSSDAFGCWEENEKGLAWIGWL